MLGKLNPLSALQPETVSLVMKTIKRFLTDVEQFDNSYLRNDHFQKRENQKLIPRYAELIKQKYQRDRKPISILDFCCGHGIPTFQLLEKLLELNVPVQKVVGYDVSDENLGYAQKNNPLPNLIQFQVKNVETQFNDVEKYDVVVALFGLHWMNDAEKAIEKIHKSLKSGGLFLSITPLENQELFAFREKMMFSPRWKDQFPASDFQFHKFHETADFYRKPLNKLFNSTRDEVTKDFYEYNTTKMITFFESWFQEVRHFIHGQKSALKKEILAKSYIAEFLYEIPQGFQGQYMTKKTAKYRYAHPLYLYEGTKKR